MFVFPEPQPLLTPAAKFPGIDGRKMSKSYNNFISLTEDPDSIREKLSRMVNDPRRARLSEPGNPDDCPVGDLHKLFSGDEVRMRTDSGCRTAGISCIECKSLAADSVIQIVQPIRLRRLNLEKSPDAVWKILDRGAQRARDAAEESMRMVREAMGLSHDLGSMRPSARPALGAQSHVHPDLSYWDAEPTERGNYCVKSGCNIYPAQSHCKSSNIASIELPLASELPSQLLESKQTLLENGTFASGTRRMRFLFCCAGEVYQTNLSIL